MQEKITVKGVLVFDNEGKKYTFNSGWRRDMFDDNGTFISSYSNLTFIAEHTIEIDDPKIDLITPQINALDKKEKEVKFKYQQALEHINIERNNLLAITNEVSDA